MLYHSKGLCATTREQTAYKPAQKAKSKDTDQQEKQNLLSTDLTPTNIFFLQHCSGYSQLFI